MLSKEIIFIDYRELNVYLRILPPPPKSILPKVAQGGGKNRARAQIVALPGFGVCPLLFKHTLSSTLKLDQSLYSRLKEFYTSIVSLDGP